MTESRAVTAMTNALHWAYDRSLYDGFGFASAESLADDHLRATGNTETAIHRLVSRQVGMAGAAGFVTGLGGMATLPVAIPANLLSVLLIQLRLVAAIAHLRGHDIHSARVRGLSTACLIGDSLTELIKDTGIALGQRAALHAIGHISAEALARINQRVGFILVTKTGTAGLVNLSRLVPIMGGVISGAIDAGATLGIAAAAKMVFPVYSENNELHILNHA